MRHERSGRRPRHAKAGSQADDARFDRGDDGATASADAPDADDGAISRAQGARRPIACCSTGWATSSSCSSRTPRSPPPCLDIALTARGDGAPMCGVPVACRRRLSRAADPGRAPRRDRRADRDARAGARSAAAPRRWSRARIVRARDRGHADRGGAARRARRQLAGRDRRGRRADRASRRATSRPGASSSRRCRAGRARRRAGAARRRPRWSSRKAARSVRPAPSPRRATASPAARASGG